MQSSVMPSCETLTEMGQLYATIKQLTANINQIKQENVALRSEVKDTREWLIQLNEIMAEQGQTIQSLQSLKSPRSPPTLDNNEECEEP